jgi:hypothetical protein
MTVAITILPALVVRRSLDRLVVSVLKARE